MHWEKIVLRPLLKGESAKLRRALERKPDDQNAGLKEAEGAITRSASAGEGQGERSIRDRVLADIGECENERDCAFMERPSLTQIVSR